MDESKLNKYKTILEQFLKEYNKYVTRIYSGQDERRTILQRDINLVSNIVSIVHGGRSLELRDSTTINFHQALSYSLTDNLPKERLNFVESNVQCTLNEAIGNIINNTIPIREIKPILPIKDQTLRKRCLDILNAPGSFDRVINQATQVLEERLRNSIPYEKLCELIPLAKDQVGEPLANKLLSPTNPIIVVSEKQPERAAFHKMVVGIIAYLRNPSHHSLNDDTKWSLAWSVVGMIDSILSELDKSYISVEKPETKHREK